MPIYTDKVLLELKIPLPLLPTLATETLSIQEICISLTERMAEAAVVIRFLDLTLRGACRDRDLDGSGFAPGFFNPRARR